MSGPKAEDIGSFDVVPSWERPQLVAGESRDPIMGAFGCQCGLCRLAAAGDL